MTLTCRIDARELFDCLDVAQRETRNACRRAVDRSARAARKDAIVSLSKDIGVSKSAFASSVPTVRGTTAGSLTASWTISKKRVLIALTSGAKLPVRGLSGLQANTFRDTGGGSASLNAPKAFTIMVGGQRIVMVRRGRGRGDIRPIYAENPVAGMSQGDGAPRRKWEEVANARLSVELPIEIQKAFDGQRIALDGGGE